MLCNAIPLPWFLRRGMRQRDLFVNDYIRIYHIGEGGCGQEALWYRMSAMTKGAFILSENARWPGNTAVDGPVKLICHYCKRAIYIKVVEDHKYAEAHSTPGVVHIDNIM